MLKQGQDKLEEKEDIVELDVEGAVKSEYPNPMFKGLRRRKCVHVRTCLPNTRKRTVSTVNPNNWIGLRPQLSINKKVTQYPGIRTADKIRFITQTWRKAS